MGRLPDTYYDDVSRVRYRINRRYVYTMPGEMVVAVNASGPAVNFPSTTFLHNEKMPFEIHRAIITIVGLNSSSAVLPTLATDDKIWLMDNLVRLTIKDTTRDALITKAEQLVADLVERNTRVWNWGDPYYLKNSQGFAIAVSNTATTAIVAPAITNLDAADAPGSQTLSNLRVNIAFEGFKIALGERVL